MEVISEALSLGLKQLKKNNIDKNERARKRPVIVKNAGFLLATLLLGLDFQEIYIKWNGQKMAKN